MYGARNHLKRKVTWSVVLWLAVACILTVRPARAADVDVKVGIDKTTVYVGEPVRMEITITGSDQKPEIDTSAVKSFRVMKETGSANNSTSITIINGRRYERASRTYVTHILFIPEREGRFTIPALPVKVAGKRIKTDPFDVTVQKPEETDDVKLRLSVSKTTCYEGEQLRLRLTWYLRDTLRGVEGYQFLAPLLDDPDFKTIESHPFEQSITGKPVDVTISGQALHGRRGGDVIGRMQYTTISFERILVPLKPGRIELPMAVVRCNAVVGYRSDRRGMFNDSFFQLGRRPILKYFVVPSNRPVLNVLPLPAKGRPAAFSGIVGSLKVRAEASPVRVNVGDPITLTLTLTGLPAFDYVKIPPLAEDASLSRDFKIPAEAAAGSIEQNKKTFTQTIRARRADIARIPSIEIPYFDPDKRRYAVASTEPIPIEVAAVKKVTVGDLVGMGPQASRSDIESLSGGIAQNYYDPSVLWRRPAGASDLIGSPVWLIVLLGLPCVYIVLLVGLTIHRWRNRDTAAVRARRAASGFHEGLARAVEMPAAERVDALQDRFRDYLGGKFKTNATAMTAGELEGLLAAEGVPKELATRAGDVQRELEAAVYAGGSLESDEALARVVDEMRQIVKEIEKCVR